MGGVYYYSALAHHLESKKPGVVARHQQYLDCLRASGVKVELGRFKKKPTRCRHCLKSLRLREEKETDVAVGVKVLELFFTGEAEQVVIVSGDTDVAPAVRAAQRLFPGMPVCFAFPFARRNDELSQSKDVRTCIQITKEAYQRHQFPASVTINGRTYTKPASW